MLSERPALQVSINGATLLPLDDSPLDAIQDGPDTFHVLVDGVRYQAVILSADYPKKSFQVRVNGNVYAIRLADKYDQLIEQLGLAQQHSTLVKDIKAPMPGLVLDILVEPGQPIKQGDTLLILEAMKMENVLKAPSDAVIRELLVRKGEAVQKKQLLLSLE